MGSELSCTPGKQWGGGMGGESEVTRSLPLSPSSLPSFFFREFFSLALLSERLEQAKFAVKLHFANFIYKKIVMQSLTCWKRLVYLLCYIEK